MTPKNPDRFERIVLAAIKKQDTPESPSIWLNGPDVVKLLRQEHRAVVRMVKKELKQCRTSRDTAVSDETYVGWACRMAGCCEILDRLKEKAT